MDIDALKYFAACHVLTESLNSDGGLRRFADGDEGPANLAVRLKAAVTAIELAFPQQSVSALKNGLMPLIIDEVALRWREYCKMQNSNDIRAAFTRLDDAITNLFAVHATGKKVVFDK